MRVVEKTRSFVLYLFGQFTLKLAENLRMNGPLLPVFHIAVSLNGSTIGLSASNLEVQVCRWAVYFN